MLTCHPELISVPRLIEIRLVVEITRDAHGNIVYTHFGEVVSGGNLSRFDYEGKEFDSLVGDYDFHFRKYKAEWALFLQPDTLIQNVYDPQSLNRYSFERNNPYKNTDPTGHFGWVVTLIIVIFIIGLTFSADILVKSQQHERDVEKYVLSQQDYQGTNEEPLSEGEYVVSAVPTKTQKERPATMEPDYERIIADGSLHKNIDLDINPEDLTLDDVNEQDSPFCSDCTIGYVEDEKGRSSQILITPSGNEYKQSSGKYSKTGKVASTSTDSKKTSKNKKK